MKPTNFTAGRLGDPAFAWFSREPKTKMSPPQKNTKIVTKGIQNENECPPPKEEAVFLMVVFLQKKLHNGRFPFAPLALASRSPDCPEEASELRLKLSRRPQRGGGGKRGGGGCFGGLSPFLWRVSRVYVSLFLGGFGGKATKSTSICFEGILGMYLESP